MYASVLLTRENPNEAPDLVGSDHGAGLQMLRTGSSKHLNGRELPTLPAI